MLIWKYFKCVPSEKEKRKDEGLLEPIGPLSKSVPVQAIELASAKVKKLVQPGMACARDSGAGVDSISYAQRYEVGKKAAEHGTWLLC